MGVEVSVVIDDRVSRYVQHEAQQKQQSPTAILGKLLQEWYETQLRSLHDQYLRGDITLRRMASQLGLTYRELYEELEQRGLPL